MGVGFEIANFWDTPTPHGFLRVGTVTDLSDHTGTKRALLPSDCSFRLPALPVSLTANRSLALGGKRCKADFLFAAEVDFFVV